MRFTINRLPNEALRDTLQREVFRSCEIVDLEQVDNTVFAAVYSPSSGQIHASLVFIDETTPDSYLIKQIHEADGPFDCRSPQRLLEMLSPTQHTEAQAWRDACRTSRTVPARP